MMKRAVGADLGLTVRLLRFLHDWTRGDLERESGVDRKRIYLYEKGKLTPTPAVLDRLEAAANVPLAEVEPLIPALRRLIRRTGEDAPAVEPETGAEPSSDRLLRAVADAVEAALPRIAAAHSAHPPQPATRLSAFQRQLQVTSEKGVDRERATRLAGLARRLAERGY
ncbi:MAG TPA: helix-turn-helix domain-containing protein [Thermoanaerobaculia bacterium]|nr:helix-turn-helix domain-containing protein [Thermoanaerobaculia bacterium]